MSDISAMKFQARAVAMEALLLMDADSLDAGARQIQRRLLGLPEYQDATSVFTYLSTDDEISTDVIVSEAASDGKRLFVPLFADGAYRLIEYLEGDTLHVGHFGIREPERRDEVLPESLLAVLPGVAFDRHCHRLGRGGGFYDRILSRVVGEGVSIFTAGLTYDATLCGEVPVEACDFDVDIVITENESVRRPA